MKNERMIGSEFEFQERGQADGHRFNRYVGGGFGALLIHAQEVLVEDFVESAVPRLLFRETA